MAVIETQHVVLRTVSACGVIRYVFMNGAHRCSVSMC